ncbi:LppX_LprAFG lipoprotein [Actinoallomurus purpureus]|uniref:LppX_LprAFG lipoprotein n=1 Tax=Actinoallomurus purpureus TaxID=478114 RepID=UPI002092EA2C|nr:LppX_LprAFG lipoprotein [Actinoallomurus purpureus]MCO6004525.1 LppX_LprAFG lipoprotein [Actinoallomurus purpureus]
MVRRYAVGTAAGAALMVSLAGCGGAARGGGADAVNVSAAQAIGLAAQKTSTVKSYKVDITESGSGQAASKAHGVVQVRLRPDLAAVGTLDQAGFGGHSVESGLRAILLGDNIYGKVPSQLTQFTGGKPWVKFSVSKAAQQAGVDLNAILKQADPAQQTKIFTSSKDVRKAGTQTIDGVKTTHYTGTITAKDAAAQLNGKAKQSFQDLYQKSGAKSVAFDLWVGADNLPRKLTAKSAASDGAATATMIYSDYNKSFSVSAPPANQVADGNSLTQSWGGGHSPRLPG